MPSGDQNIFIGAWNGSAGLRMSRIESSSCVKTSSRLLTKISLKSSPNRLNQNGNAVVLITKKAITNTVPIFYIAKRTNYMKP